MAIEYICPSGHPLTAPGELAGRRVRCLQCDQWVIVPSRNSDETPSDDSGPTTVVNCVVPSVPTPPAPPELPHPAVNARPMPPPLPGNNGAGKKHFARSTDRSVHASAAYRPDRGKTRNVCWLGAILGSVVLFGALPAVFHGNLETAPGWARLVLLVAVLEGGYVAWMVATPDWSTIWVLMLVFAATSVGYGTAMGIAAATPLDAPLPLGMGEVRASVARWCGAVLLLHVLATYLCGYMSVKWHRSFELEVARRNRA